MLAHGLINKLREELKRYVDERIASIVKYLPYSVNSADGTGDAVKGYPTEGTDEQAYDFAARRVFPFGIRSRPPVGTTGVWIGKAGHTGDGVIVAAESSRFGPSNLNDGEVAIYNKTNGTTILLDQNGNIKITPGSGATIQLGGNSFSMVLSSLIADLHSWVFAVNAVLASNVASIGAPLAGYAGNAAILAAFSSTTGAANAYQSTVVKNG